MAIESNQIELMNIKRIEMLFLIIITVLSIQSRWLNYFIQEFVDFFHYNLIETY